MKIKVTQDTLYEYILAHDLKMTRLAELIGKSDNVVFSCFKHHNDTRGNARYFSAKNIAAINEALPVIASELHDRLLTFGSPYTYTNRNGATYDPALVENMKEIGRYINITAMTQRLLGWNQFKKSAVIVQKNSNSYGCISKEDVIIINNELLSIAGVLNSYELIPNNESNVK